MTFKVEFCASYELVLEFHIGTNDYMVEESYFFDSDPSIESIKSKIKSIDHLNEDGSIISNNKWLKKDYESCLEELKEILTKNERGVKEEISTFNNSSCECSCDIELDTFLKTKLGTEHTIQAFKETLTPESKGSSINVNNLESVIIDLDPCLDKRSMMLQVVQVEEERDGRSATGTKAKTSVVINKTLEDVPDFGKIDLSQTDFKSCLEYRVELVERRAKVPGTGRIVNTEPILQNRNLNNWKVPVVDIVNIDGELTTITIRDVETDDSCAIR